MSDTKKKGKVYDEKTKYYFGISSACLISACGDTQPSDVKDVSESEESNRTDILYAYFGAEDVREYPIEYTGNQKTAEELAHELPRR